MASEAILRIKVITDATQAAAGLDKTAQTGGRFGSAMRKAMLPAAAVGAALLAVGKKSLDAASDLEQAQGAVEAVFGAQASAVERYASTADRRMGLSAASYQQYGALVGKALQNAGMTVRESVEGTDKVMQRAADLSALYGGTTAEAVEAITAAVSRSEFDPLEKYGVTLNMTAVNAELAARGQDKLTGAALDSAKKAIILEQVFKKSAEAQGQFAKESDTAAVSQQQAEAAWTNASAALGQVLLPVVTKVAQALAAFGRWAQKNATVVQILAGVIAGLVVAIMAVNVALTIMSATPVVLIIGAIVLGVVALVTALIVLYKRVGWVRTILQAVGSAIASTAQTFVQMGKAIWTGLVWVFDWIKGHWPLLVAILTGPIGIAVMLIVKYWSRIKASAKAVWEWLKRATRVVGQALRKVWTTVRDAVVKVFTRIRAIAKAVLDRVKSMFLSLRDKVRAVWDAIRDRVVRVLDRIKTAVMSMRDRVRAAWDAIRDTVVRVVDRIKSVWTSAMDRVKSAVTSARDRIKAAWDAVKTAVQGVIDKIGTLVSKVRGISVPGAIKTAFESIKTVVDRVISAVESLINKLRNIPTPDINWPDPPAWFGKLNPFSAEMLPPVPAGPTPRGGTVPTVGGYTAYTRAPRVAGGRTAATGGGAPIVINVTGALDPDRVARQIRSILRGHERRVGAIR